jgi:hypothetical protein
MKLSNQQRAFLQLNERFGRDVVTNGKVIRRGDPKSNGAIVARTIKEVRRDKERLRDRNAIASMREALSLFSNEELSAFATKGEYKAVSVSRVKSSAMPMNFWRGTGYGC